MATTLKQILDSLEKSDKDALNYAFEHDLTYHVRYDSGRRFIGVNTSHVPFLRPDPAMSVGVWSVGEVAGATKPVGV